MSKLVEKSVHKQLVAYLNENELFSEYQSGYRQFHSCETALTHVYNNLLLGSSNQSHQGMLVLLDLSAAFDTLNHEMLLSILKDQYGFSGLVLAWLRSYLSNRSFRVKVKQSKSGVCYLTIGVPQGSILGPLLFILFTKGIEAIAKKYGFDFHCYADDCQIYFCFKPNNNVDDHMADLSACLLEIQQWMTAHFLKLNHEKTEAVELFPFRNQDQTVHCVTFNGDIIKTQSTAKSLGILFDNKLSFEPQINHIIKSINYRIKNISRIGSKLSSDLKLTLAQSYCLTQLDYCNVLYYGITQRLENKLQSSLNAVARFAGSVYGRHWRQQGSMFDLLRDLHILPISYRIRFKLCLLCFKCLNGMAPQYLTNLLQLRVPNRYSLRCDNDFFLLEEPRKPFYKKMENAFSIAAPSLWNSLPYSIRSLNSINAFKSSLKTYYYRLAFE